MYNAIRNTRQAKAATYAIVMTSILPMLIGYYQFFTGTGGREDIGFGSRINGGFGMPNMYGIFLALCLCACFILIVYERKKYKRAILSCITASIIVSSILALNRGSWIALLTAIVFATLFHIKKVKFRWFLIGGLAIGILFSGLIIERFTQLQEKTPWGTTKNTLDGRMEMWSAVLSVIPKHPITGFGIGASAVTMAEHSKFNDVPHNDYLRLLLESGVFGPLLYICFLFRELYRNIKNSRIKKTWFVNYAMLIACVYWIIISSTQNIIHSVTTFPIFFTLIAITRRWNEYEAV
jgi:O-antigen ligase